MRDEPTIIVGGVHIPVHRPLGFELGEASVDFGFESPKDLTFEIEFVSSPDRSGVTTSMRLCLVRGRRSSRALASQFDAPSLVVLGPEDALLPVAHGLVPVFGQGLEFRGNLAVLGTFLGLQALHPSFAVLFQHRDSALTQIARALRSGLDTRGL